ncbi:hypothetical protein [Rhodococcus sp. OK302]|uniref:hypothetical protein n=1 Tax=Rhodococcus sp. OK302 TaxID=1882769 RepID=UPI000B9F30F8|nr:hypothetical protein [Rhodococcus sp. OK302]OYD69960.1 hypothetical protein BDB13_3548 [Rhodococcus sp. OK302]
MTYLVLVLSNYRYLTMEGEVILGHAPTDAEIAAVRQLPRDERVGRISPGLFGLSFSESHRERWEAAAVLGGHDLDELIGPVVWSVSSRLDESRWFRSMGDMAWTADDETAVRLFHLPTHQVALRPTGPWRDGVFTPSELLAAVYNVIPAAEVHGAPPDFPFVSPLPPGAIP